MKSINILDNKTPHVANTVKPLYIVPGSVVQFLWSLSESISTMAPASIVFPDPLFLFQTPDENDE
jgi:hypothetical protein